MNISVRWLNEYLDPANITADSAERVLTDAGFPIESATELPDGDVLLDVEVTSNRGDCLSHIGLAREIAAATGRKFRPPPVPPTPSSPSGNGPDSVVAAAALDNRVPELCRLFTVRVIRGVKVGPSPAWLVRALESIGQRSINNVVDVTNFVAAEFGQPSHVFDLATIRKDATGKPAIVVRTANDGERLALLDGKTVTLKAGELVVADGDGSRPISLAGIMGGAETEVTEKTVDILLEAATWDPGTIRRAARRLNLRTNASYRFERTVDPRTIDLPARRIAALIRELAGGKLLTGVLEAGAVAAPPDRITMRPDRCREIIGVPIPTPEIVRILLAHDIGVEQEAETVDDGRRDCLLVCTPPPWRPDLTREIDLIEEIARTHGLDKVPVHERIAVRVKAPQADELAARRIGETLTGLGFYETVTFSFVSPKEAAPFTPAGVKTLEVADERRKGSGVLRPSILPSLLACRKANQDGGVTERGGVRLFETAAVFGEGAPGSARAGATIERRNLALIADAAFPEGAKAAEQRQNAVRLVRGALEEVAAAVGGAAARLGFTPAAPPLDAFDPSATAQVTLNGQVIGHMGLIAPAVQRLYDLTLPVAAAEVDLAALVALYPPKAKVATLPAFPGIERDLSLVVSENVPWAKIEALVLATGLKFLEERGVEFVGTYRGQQIGQGKKSVTLRLKFREPTRTLRHEEVDGEVAAVIERAKAELGAELRG